MSKNPWLAVSASDYEEHMGSPQVDQLSFLAELFQHSLSFCHDGHLALLGCATGNGLHALEHREMSRVTVVDFHPGYLDVLRKRYEASVCGLEIVQADLSVYDLDPHAYSLIFAGLIFEYVDPASLLQRAASALREDGSLVVVLQQEHRCQEKISTSTVVSLQKLSHVMKLVDLDAFGLLAKRCGLKEVSFGIETLSSGKSFAVLVYSRDAELLELSS